MELKKLYFNKKLRDKKSYHSVMWLKKKIKNV